MLHKILIIDDNHSFIDSLTVMLKDYSFQYDSAFRFMEAQRKLDRDGSFLNRQVIKQLFDFDENLKDWESHFENVGTKKGSDDDEDDDEIQILAPPEVPSIKGSYLNPTGFSLVIIEHDTETSLKGLGFAKTLVRTNPEWNENDFLILTSRPGMIEAEAKEAGIAVIEKPLQNAPLRQFINQRLKVINEIQERAKFLFDNLENQRESIQTSAIAKAQKRAVAAKKPSARSKLLSKLKRKSKKSPSPPKPKKSPKAKTATKKGSKTKTKTKTKARAKAKTVAKKKSSKSAKKPRAKKTASKPRKAKAKKK